MPFEFIPAWTLSKARIISSVAEKTPTFWPVTLGRNTTCGPRKGPSKRGFPERVSATSQGRYSPKTTFKNWGPVVPGDILLCHSQ